MNVLEFSFRDHAPEFDWHIVASIPGYRELRTECASLSRRFVENDTTVVDIGCTTGSLLADIRMANGPARPRARYVGIDVEAGFEQHWRARRAYNLDFQVADALTFTGFAQVSLALSLFTVQFLPERHKRDLLGRIYRGLVEGGALIIAEKVLANTARFQDALTFDYYDFKARTFSAAEILGKERQLRGQMRLWTEDELVEALLESGFKLERLQRFFQRQLFIAYVAIK